MGKKYDIIQAYLDDQHTLNSIITLAIIMVEEPILQICLIDNNSRLTKMQQQHSQQGNNILQFTSMSLFDQDPLSPDFSILESQGDIISDSPHLINQQQLLSETHYKVGLQADHVKGRIKAQLLITSYRLIIFEILSDKDHKEQQNKKMRMPISLPYGFIEEVDIVKGEIIIVMKTGISYKVKPFSELKNIYQTILCGFTYLPYFTKQISQQQQQCIYDCLAQLQRMRIPWQRYIIIPNNNGKMIPTYPKYFVIPKAVSQNLLEECCKIRNSARVPVLSYYNCESGAGIWRAARQKINQENNKYNKAYLKEVSRSIIIFDARQDETISKDEAIHRRFETLHGIHELLKKILSAYSKDEPILKLISRWFQQISNIINTAYLVVDHLQLGKEVLLQQNHGFDRVAQISALAQLILDPYFRTIRGFSLLLEKQFVSFGHPFGRRLGFQREKIGQSSPVLIQFLDCVNQLLVTHPNCFQFSSHYIAKIAYQSYSTKYSNFFYNSQRERLAFKFITKTPSIWKMPMRKEYYNYQWVQQEAVKPLLKIRKPPSMKQFLIWKEYYDMVTKMSCQYPQQAQVKLRRSSIYKNLQRRNSRDNI